MHQLRHAHATELINAGVSIEAVRRRLGHASAETTQLYALLDDKVADAGTGRRAKEASQPGAASAHCNQDPSQRQRLSADSSTPD
ncbi:site-specific integrase [Nonomuraea sp. NPDC000554]|uniref:site-specific integrase n=1 Tax=Nonomuraea sp. NPDC000554 TaxID=3154259 RepID=UPI003322BC43